MLDQKLSKYRLYILLLYGFMKETEGNTPRILNYHISQKDVTYETYFLILALIT